MATNATQKDKALQEVIDWCLAKKESFRKEHSCREWKEWKKWLDDEEYSLWCNGADQALDELIEHCKNMLG